MCTVILLLESSKQLTGVIQYRVTSYFLQILINGLTLSLMDVGDIPYGFVCFEEGFLLTAMSEEHEHLSCAQ